MNRSDTPGDVPPNAAAHATNENVVDVKQLANAVNEILVDMNQGACAETITQTVQVFTLANGKKAAVRVIVTTDQDLFM